MKCNHLDLHLFQIDWDLTFGVVFLNADKTIYARYGTRNSLKADDDVDILGLAATMQAVLEIHQQYPEGKQLLVQKQPVSIKQSIPEDFSSLDHFKPKLDYEGEVAKSCIHCHQVRDAARVEYRSANKPLPQELLYPFPSPRVLGLFLDTKSCATVSKVDSGSVMDKAGIHVGDVVKTIDDQRVDSEADIRWMLHNLDSDTSLISLGIMRNGARQSLDVSLKNDWRSHVDLSWRTTTWDMRRMATGGMTLIPLSRKNRKEENIFPANKMALRAGHVGMYGHHARAKKAGIQKNDVIVSFDGRHDLMTENAVIEHALQRKQSGDSVEIKYLRDGKIHTTRIKLQ